MQHWLQFFASSGVETLWTPREVSTFTWWNAARQDTLTAVAGDVSGFRDHKGNGIDLAQGTGANQPKTGTVTLNSLNVLDFNGSTDFLDVAFAALTQGFSMFVVCKSDGGGGYVFDGNNDNSDNTILGKSVPDGDWFIHAGTFLAYEEMDTNPHVLKVRFDGVSSSLSIDGTAGSTGDAGSENLNGFTLGSDLGATTFWDGGIAEILIIDGFLSSDNEAITEGYLAWKWGLEANLPGGHAYKDAAPILPAETLWDPNYSETEPFRWWDASQTQTITAVANAVSEIRDPRGLGTNPVQATGADQPDSGTRTINSLNVLDFDGATEFLQVSFGATVLSQENTIFIVSENDTGLGTQYVMDGSSVSNRNISGISSGDDNFINAGTEVTFSAADTNPHIFNIKYNGTSSSLSIDGTAGSSVDAGTGSIGGITIGADYLGANNWNGAIAEVIVIDGALSSADNDKMEGYLAWKWGLEDNLPGGHPYKSAAPTL